MMNIENSRNENNQAHNRWTQLRHAVAAVGRLARPEAATIQQPWQIENPPRFLTQESQDKSIKTNFNPNTREQNDLKPVVAVKQPLDVDFVPPSMLSDSLNDYRFVEKLFELVTDGNTTEWIKAYRSDKKKGIFDTINASSTINMPNKFGLTMLHVAAQNGDVKMMNILLKNGADPTLPCNPPPGFKANSQDSTGTALDFAIAWRHAPAVSVLLKSRKYDKPFLEKCLKRFKNCISTQSQSLIEEFITGEGYIGCCSGVKSTAVENTTWRKGDIVDLKGRGGGVVVVVDSTKKTNSK